MLTNNELKDIENTVTLLTAILDYAITKETLYKETGITAYDIDQKIIKLNNIRTKALKDKEKVNQRSYQYNLEHKEYNRITVNMAKAKKYKNPERYEYWRHQFEEYKKRREVK